MFSNCLWISIFFTKFSFLNIMWVTNIEILFATVCLLIYHVFTLEEFNSDEILRPRGVPLAKNLFYESTKVIFTCMDGTKDIPYFWVNDDYCDCTDGSDEPGTAACTEGKFYCANSGFIPIEIPSSRVNDQICDCCDGSDEYNSTMDCLDTCFELGKQAREEAQKQEELYNKGFTLWQEYSSQGQKIKSNNKVTLQKLKVEEIEAEKVKNEKEAVKLDSEAKEKSALSKYEALKEEIRREAEESEMQVHHEKEKNYAESAFKELDINQDGVLQFDEIQQFQKFDSNGDGIVTKEEAKFFLHMKDFMEFEEFVTTGWMIMKPLYTQSEEQKTAEESSDSENASQKPNDDHENNQFESTDDYNEEDLTDDLLSDDEEDDDQIQTQPEFPPKDSSSENSQVSTDLQYDEETQNLINEATVARQEYKEAFDNLERIRNDIKQVQIDLETDFGLNEQFAILKGQCFDYDDREYTYRLCPFDRASQIPKSGGSEINLGKWGLWIGSENNKYQKMKYENGNACWNGPSRSTIVLLHCGLENKIFFTSEPNRCEYLFEFSTPAFCASGMKYDRTNHDHTEL